MLGDESLVEPSLPSNAPVASGEDRAASESWTGVFIVLGPLVEYCSGPTE
jgi:hypothetical protein